MPVKDATQNLNLGKVAHKNEAPLMLNLSHQTELNSSVNFVTNALVPSRI